MSRRRLGILSGTRSTTAATLTHAQWPKLLARLNARDDLVCALATGSKPEVAHEPRALLAIRHDAQRDEITIELGDVRGRRSSSSHHVAYPRRIAVTAHDDDPLMLAVVDADGRRTSLRFRYGDAWQEE